MEGVSDHGGVRRGLRAPGRDPALGQHLRIGAHEPEHPSYRLAEIARALSDAGFPVVSGGGPGIMAAANKGAFAGASPSVRLNILLRHERAGNPYQNISPWCVRVPSARPLELSEVVDNPQEVVDAISKYYEHRGFGLSAEQEILLHL